MTRTYLVVLAIVATFAQSMSSALKASSTNVPTTLTSLENQWVTAIVKRDTATLDRIFADTYVDTNEDGDRTNKQGVLTLVKSSDLSMQSIALSDTHVEVYGTAAVVTGSATQIGTYKGTPLTRNVVFTDTFVIQSGVWRAVASQRAPRR
jgi:disulfide oxidoreductase YuzD